jgi:pyruvate,orthophosphate dikinase
MAEKKVYFFGEGNAKMKELLGGKGANLAEMTNLGVPVPPGFTITTKMCRACCESKGKWPKGLREEVTGRYW